MHADCVLERGTQVGLLTSADQAAVEEALDFLFRVRNGLHYHYGRKNDLLSVDVQEKLAAALGFEASANKRAVEHFLKAYYVHANVISAFCHSTLEAVSHTYQPRLRRFLQRPRRLDDVISHPQAGAEPEAPQDRQREIPGSGADRCQRIHNWSQCPDNTCPIHPGTATGFWTTGQGQETRAGYEWRGGRHCDNRPFPHAKRCNRR